MLSLYSEFQQSAQKYASNKALRFKDENNLWQSLTYEDLLRQIDCLAQGLKKIGLNVSDHIALFSENRPEWVISDLAINRLGAVSVPIHAIANQVFLEYCLDNSESNFLIVSQKLFDAHCETILKKENLKIILISQNQQEKIEGKIFLFSDLVQENIQLNESIKYEPKDLASIIYTSGTTGTPKGVMLSNWNFIFDTRGALESATVYPTDIFLSFLPLSHVLERTAGNYAALLSGAEIVYSQGIKNVADDLKNIKPTIIISVPKIFERIYEKIFAQVQAQSQFFKKIFFWSLKQKSENWQKKTANLLVYRKIKQVFGGRLRFAVSGGAGINEKILKFFHQVGVVILEGYGLTETSPISACNCLNKENRIGSVGQPLDGVEIKIASDKEILIKGPNVMLGYWKNPQADQESFDENGWFRSGDLGFMDKERFITIIGRKKDIIVTSNGKNIMPEKLESILNLSPYIFQSVVVGHKKSFLTALIVPDRTIIQGEFGLEADIKKVVQTEIDKFNKQIDPQEWIRNFHIMEKPFTIEADELTPTLKIRRRIIEGKYDKEIKKMY